MIYYLPVHHNYNSLLILNQQWSMWTDRMMISILCSMSRSHYFLLEIDTFELCTLVSNLSF